MKNIQRGDKTDCRTEDGITVTIIDTISFLVGQLMERNLETPAAKEALQDLLVNGKNYRSPRAKFSILISIKKS